MQSKSSQSGAGHWDNAGTEWARVIGLAAILLLVYAPYVLSFNILSHSFLKGDSFYYRAALISIVEDGDLIMNNNVGRTDPLNGFLALGRENQLDRLVPKHPILMPVVSIPFYLALGTVGLLAFNIGCVVAVVILIYLLNRTVVDWRVAWLVAFLYGTATLLLNYTYNYSPDVFSTLIVLAAIVTAFNGLVCSSAVFLGMALFAKLPNVLPAAAVGVYLIYRVLVRPAGATRSPLRRRWATLCLLAALFFLAVLPMLLVNDRLYGAPWITGYHREITAEGIDNHIGKFREPFLPGLTRLLFDRWKGVITTNPIVALSVPGVVFAWRCGRRVEFATVGAICLMQVVFFARYEEWAASHYSNRFLMTTVVLSSFFLAPAAERLFFSRLKSAD